jgi:hypothetical protein
VVGFEFLIVEFSLLVDNWDAPLGVPLTIESQQSTIAVNHGLLGRRLMVGQVPLEHFI